jgi:hypothetical protein
MPHRQTKFYRINCTERAHKKNSNRFSIRFVVYTTSSSRLNERNQTTAVNIRVRFVMLQLTHLLRSREEFFERRKPTGLFLHDDCEAQTQTNDPSH